MQVIESSSISFWCEPTDWSAAKSCPQLARVAHGKQNHEDCKQPAAAAVASSKRIECLVVEPHKTTERRSTVGITIINHPWLGMVYTCLYQPSMAMVMTGGWYIIIIYTRMGSPGPVDPLDFLLENEWELNWLNWGPKKVSNRKTKNLGTYSKLVQYTTGF